MFKRSLHLLFSLSPPRRNEPRLLPDINDFLSLLLPRLDATRFDSSVEERGAPCFWLQRGLKALKRIARNAEIREERAANPGLESRNRLFSFFISVNPEYPRKNLRVPYLTRKFIYWKISNRVIIIPFHMKFWILIQYNVIYELLYMEQFFLISGIFIFSRE